MKNVFITVVMVLLYVAKGTYVGAIGFPGLAE